VVRAIEWPPGDLHHLAIYTLRQRDETMENVAPQLCQQIDVISPRVTGNCVILNDEP